MDESVMYANSETCERTETYKNQLYIRSNVKLALITHDNDKTFDGDKGARNKWKD